MTKDTTPRKTLHMFSPSDLTIIGHDTEDGPEHPHYDPRIKLPVDDLMVRNIAKLGVLKPIFAIRDGNRVIVTDGRRRTIHARLAASRLAEAGETDTFRIPVMIQTGSDQEIYGKSRAANRMNVQDGQLASARSAQKLVDMGSTVDEVAEVFGVSDQTIRNYLQLLSLAPEVIAAMESDELGTTAALALVPLDAEQQVAALTELKKDSAEGSKVTVGKAKRVAAAAASGAKPSAAKVTPKERVEKAVALLTKASGGPNTKEAFAETLNKLSRVLAGKSFDKLAESEEE